MKDTIVVLVVSVGCAFTLSGCGGPERIPVVPASGTVTYSNLPLDGATLVFAPEGDGKYVGSAISVGGGEFEIQMNNQKGALPGRYKVIVTKYVHTDPVLDSGGHEESPGESQLLTPYRYSRLETTDLSVEVPDGGSTDLKIVVPEGSTNDPTKPQTGKPAAKKGGGGAHGG